MKRLPIMCPSNLGSWDDGLYAEPCTTRTCMWWDGSCSAARQVEADLAPKRDRRRPPACALADRCRWHLDAVRRGLSTCVPRRLGLLCQHQGGTWNTFEFQENLL